jgi:hypothetical protein
LRGERRAAALLGHERDGGGHVAADAVAHDRDPRRVRADLGGVFGDPLEDGVRLLVLDGVLRLRSGRVGDEDNDDARRVGDLAHEALVCVLVSEIQPPPCV